MGIQSARRAKRATRVRACPSRPVCKEGCQDRARQTVFYKSGLDPGQHALELTVVTGPVNVDAVYSMSDR